MFVLCASIISLEWGVCVFTFFYNECYLRGATVHPRQEPLERARPENGRVC